MTAKDISDKIKAVIDNQRQNAILNVMVPATTRLLGDVKNRIQQDGEKTDGGKIGQYSTKSMYATEDQFDKKSAFKPQGKRESIEYATVDVKGNKKTGTIKYGTVRNPKAKTVQSFGKNIPAKNVQGFNFEERQSMYLPGGYKELRNLQGKRIDTVNITYRGDLMNSYQQVVNDKSIEQGLTTEEQALKAEGLQDGTSKKKGYGDILKPGQKELDRYKSAVSELNKLEIQKIMNA